MNVKRLFSLLFISVSFLLIGCEKNEETIDDGAPTQIYVKVGEVYDIGEIGPWSTWNPFVATVWHNGKITGQHVGECIINCPYDERRYRLKVTPNITLFRDPLIQWGANKTDVIAHEGGNYQTTSDGDISYETGGSVVPYLGYFFVNERLSMTILLVNSSYKEQVFQHLSERYKFVYQEDGTYTFINANTVKEASTIVLFKAYNSLYWSVYYSPNNG